MLALTIWLALSLSSAFGADAPALEERLASQVLAAEDSARGGFVSRSGLPSESAVELAWLMDRDGRSHEWGRAAMRTMSWTHGLMDTLTGGYFHASNPRAAEVGAAEKRAESNGRRLENLMDAWRVTHDDQYRRDAARVVDWVDRVLLDGRGGFVTAQVGDRELEPASNGVMIHAWLRWAAATRDRRRRDFAFRSLDRVWDECWMDGLGLLRRNEMGAVAREPQLADQVEMGRAYLLAARLGGRAEDRRRAQALGQLVVARFQDRMGGFLTQSVPGKGGSIKKARVLVGENGRAALFLCELSALTGEPAYRDAAGRAASRLDKELGKLGFEAADWALAARAAHAPELPGPVEWTAEARENDVPQRPRVFRVKNVRR